MCLIVLANNFHKNYKLILAANRDEFYNRPTLPTDFWEDNPDLLAGKDLEAGGTWLGITKSGKYAAITNFREPKSFRKDAPSRGKLTTQFLLGNTKPDKYVSSLMKDSNNYNGYNLLVGNPNELYFYSNKINRPQKLVPGIYGLSNHLLDTPWTKVVRSKEAFKEVVKDDKLSVKKLFDLLSDKTLPPDIELPNTGMGIEIERMAAPVFIESPSYGTRCSTVILVDKNNNVQFIEKSLRINSSGKKDRITSEFEFKIMHKD
jgi:uncharacterized protein with NRDE domain